MHVYYAVLSWEGYDIYLAATEDGLCFICTGTEGKKELENWQEKYFLKRRLLRDDNKLEKYITEINDYLLGKTKIFKSPIQLCGTDFQKKVWKELQKIPFGEVRTYTDIATTLNRPQAVRAVANAIGRNPLLFIVPCHRVIRKDGNLSGFRAGVDLKDKLLQLERVSL